MREVITFDEPAKAEVKNLTNGAVTNIEDVTKAVICSEAIFIHSEGQLWQFPTALVRVCYATPAGGSQSR